MRYLSLFSGIGGFELGIEHALSETKRQQPRRDERDSPSDGEEFLGAQCVGYSEIDKYAVQIYQKHFPKHKNYGDITKITANSLPDFDLLVGGFPCQSFSIAGKRGGFDDTRGTLFFNIATILREKKPRLFLLENVKGLLSHDNGRTFSTIISTLDELGYDLQWQVLNSKNFGVPQNRERVFIVGHIRGEPRPEVFPIREVDKRIDGQVGGVQREVQTEKEKPDSRHADSEVSQDGNDRHLHQRVFDVSYPSRVREYAKTAPTVRDYGSGGNKMPIVNGVRRLTPTECERLQGFPDGWTEGISDTQRYKCLGNAVTVNVIAEIIKRIA